MQISSFLVLLTSAKVAAGPLDDAWEKADQFRFDEAYADFQRIRPTTDLEETECQYGQALCLLNIQPRRSESIERARKIFEAISKKDGLAALPSAFFLARISEFYTSPPNVEQAVAEYRRLLELKSGDPLVESGAVELVLIAFSDDKISADAIEAGLEPLSDLLKSPEGSREFHYALGMRCIENGVFMPGLHHLRAADAIGFDSWQTEAGAWLAIAETARIVGDPKVAREYYERYLVKYPQDSRHYTVEERLRSLTLGEHK